ncbi:MAG: LamG-like jellyroll fold domain-containing protein [Chitinophagaceae bacterium]
MPATLLCFRTILTPLVLVLLLPVLFPLATTAQVPGGASARYGLNGDATDASGNGNNGSLSGTVNTINRFGTAAAAVSFMTGSSSGTLPSSLVSTLQNDFSIGFWFKTAASALTGTQWFNGISLVDAETAGATDDWGICLIDGGKVCFGIGSPDITIKSVSASYNNNAWHFVTATRNKTTGTTILYIDGAQVATTTGTSTNALTAPAVIGLGRSSAVATGNYTGSLDDIIGYNRVLTPVEVVNMYTALTATALPLKWLSFAATVSQGNVILRWETGSEINNDYFTVESSADKLHFNDVGNTQGYDFTDRNKAGSWYYRIRQTDKDGQYTYSKTIRVDIQGMNRIYLQTNPVINNLVIVNPGQLAVHQIQITEITGRIVFRKAISNATTITVNIHNLQPGYYLLRVDAITLPFIRQ